MKTGINIQAEVPEGHVLDVAAAIETVFDAAHRNHIEQKTVREALAALARGATISGVTVANCNLTSNPR